MTEGKFVKQRYFLMEIGDSIYIKFEIAPM